MVASFIFSSFQKVIAELLLFFIIIIPEFFIFHDVILLHLCKY